MHDVTPDDGSHVMTLLNSVHTSPAHGNEVVNTILGLIRNTEAAAMRIGKAASYQLTKYTYQD